MFFIQINLLCKNIHNRKAENYKIFPEIKLCITFDISKNLHFRNGCNANNTVTN